MTVSTTTSDTPSHGRPASTIQIQILHVPGCPHVEPVRRVLQDILARSGLSTAIEETEGPYPSPTLLINGIDVTGRAVDIEGSAHLEASCRLDPPTEAQILAALTRLQTCAPAGMG